MKATQMRALANKYETVPLDYVLSRMEHSAKLGHLELALNIPKQWALNLIFDLTALGYLCEYNSKSNVIWISWRENENIIGGNFNTIDGLWVTKPN